MVSNSAIIKPLYVYPMPYVFQAIQNVKTKSTYGYEALLRPEDGTNPRDYINMRMMMGGSHQLEVDTFFNAAKTFSELKIPGYLFVNSLPNEWLDYHEAKAFADLYGNDLISRIVVENLEYPYISRDAWYNKQRFMLRHGMQCAIDAFGAGLNNDFTAVLFYNPHIVKISSAVIHEFTEDPQRVEYVKTVIGMLKDKDAKVLAEGIETVVEYEMLKEFGIDYAQGYYIGMPGIPDPPPFIEDGDTTKYTD